MATQIPLTRGPGSPGNPVLSAKIATGPMA